MIALYIQNISLKKSTNFAIKGLFVNEPLWLKNNILGVLPKGLKSVFLKCHCSQSSYIDDGSIQRI